MKIPDWLKHTVGGSVFIAVVGYVVDKYVKSNAKLNEQQKKIVFGTAIGAAGGGALGYYVGEQVIDGRIPDSKKKKILGAAIGAASGGGVGYFISRKAGAVVPANCPGEQPIVGTDYKIVDAGGAENDDAEDDTQGIEEKLEGGN